jgi:hypothetical protein
MTLRVGDPVQRAGGKRYYPVSTPGAPVTVVFYPYHPLDRQFICLTCHSVKCPHTKVVRAHHHATSPYAD